MSARCNLLAAGVASLTLVSCAGNPAAEIGPWSRNPPEAPTTFERAPVPTNEADVSLELRRAYPPELHATGVGGRVEVWVHVDTAGAAVSRHVKTSSGHNALDCAAMQVGSAMQFEPAMDEGQPIPAWLTHWVEFEPEPTHPPPPDRPRCEPFDTNPVHLTASDVTKWLEWFYPRDLRNQGVGGRALLWLFVDEAGDVTRHRVRESSGVEALDRAAANVATMMRFTPAKSLGIPTGVWVQQGFTFRVENPRPPLESR
ncbi:energy transducer TonB [Candidatus Palauibacter sp.]|uniref:energy transducer TonB n=1 Tax=Candidatus Palauibacter sp. TaxID=3101350 RepID=UPI003B01B36D